jgi:hypothetical protein
LQIELRDGLRDGRGVMSSEIDEAILRAGRAHTPWQALLARCFTGIRRDDYRFLPPSRRHVWRGMMLPSVGVPGPNNVVCAIDTSGSIERPLAARFLAEVHALRCNARCRLHVLQCDDAITDRRVYESWEQPPPAAMPETFKGRGGTDFRPVFDLVATDISRPEGWPDLLAYLTDGQGSFPERAPPYPVVWLLPEGSRVVYTGYKNVILRWAPLPGGGWSTTPTTAWIEPVPGVGDESSGGDGSNSWRWRTFRVEGSGTNTVIYAGGATWRQNMHVQKFATVDGVNFTPVARVNDRDGGIKQRYSYSGMNTKAVKYAGDPSRPNLELFFSPSFPSAGRELKPRRFSRNPDSPYSGSFTEAVPANRQSNRNNFFDPRNHSFQ